MATGPDHQLAQYVTWFFVYAFMGWCWEVGLRLVQHHVFVNRGFVTGPVLPIYGFGALLSVVLLHPIQNVALQFVVGALAAAVMEYTTSWVMEKLFHARWWDYTGKPFNLNGRIYLLGVVVFGIMMVVIDRVVQPVLKDLTDLVPPPALEVAAAVALAVFLVDLMTSVVHMKNFNKRLAAMQGKVAEMAEGARNRAFEVRNAASTAVENARDAMLDVRENAADAAERTRQNIADAAERSRQRLADAVDDRRDALEDRLEELRRILSRPPHPARPALLPHAQPGGLPLAQGTSAVEPGRPVGRFGKAAHRGAPGAPAPQHASPLRISTRPVSHLDTTRPARLFANWTALFTYADVLKRGSKHFEKVKMLRTRAGHAPGLTWRRVGHLLAHRKRTMQRTQPLGTCSGLGSSPSSGMRWVAAAISGSGMGTAESSARV